MNEPTNTNAAVASGSVPGDVEQQPEPSNKAGKLVTTLGCLGGLVGFTVTAGFLLASCTANPEASGRLLVEDRARLLAPATRAALERIQFSPGTPVIVRTVDSIPRASIGSYATELMGDEPSWQQLRQRGFLRTHLRQDPAWAPGVYVLVSREPVLLQLRFGPDIRLTAYQERLAAGAWYRAKQRFTPGALDSHVERTVQELALRMKNVTEPAWPLSWAHGLSSLVASEVEDFLAPSDGLYSRYALASYLRLAAACGGTGSAWRFIAFNALCLVGFWLVGKKLVLERWVLPNARATWLKVVGGLLTATGLLGTLLTGMAALSLLSRGRLEDQLALDALGLTFLSGLAFEDQLYARSGGLLLAIPGALAGLIDECMKLFDANSDPNRVVLGVPYKWLGWACALYLLPMALAVPTTLVLVWSIAGQIKKKVDEAERRRKAPPQSEFG